MLVALLIAIALLRLGLAAPAAQAAPVAATGLTLHALTGALLAQAADDAGAEPGDADAPLLGDDGATDGETTDAAAGAEGAASTEPVSTTAAPTVAPEPTRAPEPAPTAPVAAAPAPPRPTAAEPLDFPGAAVDVTLKLVAVLALAYVTLWLVKRYSVGATLGKRSSALQVIESTTLAPNRSIYLVNVEGRRLLLGVTASQITTLAAWDGAGVPQPIPTAAPLPVALDEPAPAK
jgi:flagellar protein FliO/FliZ